MPAINIKSIALIIFTLVTIAAAYLIYQMNQLPTFEPGETWAAFIANPDIEHESLIIESNDGTKLEADLLVPVGGEDKKAAVVISMGSGSYIYQNFPDMDMVTTYFVDPFLSRDTAVLLMNKRGLGQSEGNWMHNDFQGRADDTYAGVQTLQNHPSIDADAVGLLGHSQGGWIVSLVASQHDDIAFVISLAGPTTTVEEQTIADNRQRFMCDGLEGEDLEGAVNNDRRWRRIGATLGKLPIPLGDATFDANVLDYDPQEALQAVNVPMLFVFGEYDMQVPPADNLERYQEIFGDNPPQNHTVEVVPDINHILRVVEDTCDSIVESIDNSPQSDELLVVLGNWLDSFNIQ